MLSAKNVGRRNGNHAGALGAIRQTETAQGPPVAFHRAPFFFFLARSRRRPSRSVNAPSIDRSRTRPPLLRPPVTRLGGQAPAGGGGQAQGGPTDDTAWRALFPSRRAPFDAALEPPDWWGIPQRTGAPRASGASRGGGTNRGRREDPNTGRGAKMRKAEVGRGCPTTPETQTGGNWAGPTPARRSCRRMGPMQESGPIWDAVCDWSRARSSGPRPGPAGPAPRTLDPALPRSRSLGRVGQHNPDLRPKGPDADPAPLWKDPHRPARLRLRATGTKNSVPSRCPRGNTAWARRGGRRARLFGG